MLKKTSVKSGLGLLALSCVLQLSPVLAQGGAPTNWELNQQGAINQDVAGGALSTGQAAALDNREAQIQSQQQRYMSQNGGTLTPQEQQRIGSELGNVNRQMSRDVGYNAATGNPYAARAAQMQNGYGMGNGQWQNQQYANGMNGQMHHHHHNGFGGNLYGQNAYGNSSYGTSGMPYGANMNGNAYAAGAYPPGAYGANTAYGNNGMGYNNNSAGFGGGFGGLSGLKSLFGGNSASNYNGGGWHN